MSICESLHADFVYIHTVVLTEMFIQKWISYI